MAFFHFNDKHNYWPVYTTIQQYYPIGILDYACDRSFAESYPGQTELETIITYRVSNFKEYRQQWKPFQEHLRLQLKMPVHQLEGVYPAYTGYIAMKQPQAAQSTHRKELHFAVSLLGPYFTIYGLDTSSVEISETCQGMGHPESETILVPRQAIHALTVSPYEEYMELFTKLEAAIVAWFPAYRLLPFSVGRMTLAGLVVEGCEIQPASIHAALFHTTVPWQALTSSQYRGDQYYGSLQWRTVPSAS